MVERGEQDMITLEKGSCCQCGRRLIDYDLNFSNGKMKLCRDCFEEYSKEHNVIVKHCPSCVEDGGDKIFYHWEGLEKFLEDYPSKDGWAYKFSSHGNCGYIMIDALNKIEWWVIWIVDDEEIAKELREKLPEWHPRPRDNTKKRKRWFR